MKRGACAAQIYNSLWHGRSFLDDFKHGACDRKRGVHFAGSFLQQRGIQSGVTASTRARTAGSRFAAKATNLNIQHAKNAPNLKLAIQITKTFAV
jgi:hypothetical protein